MYRINHRLIYRTVSQNLVRRQIHFISTFDKFNGLTKGKEFSKKFPHYTSDFLDLKSEIQIEKLNSSQTDGLLQQATEESDIQVILEILKRGTPTRYSLERLLYSFLKEPRMIKAVEDYQGVKVWMEPYFAASIWHSGSLIEASDLFRKLFFENDKMVVLRVLNDITIDTIGHKSEATLVILTQLAEYFVCIFDDFRLLFVIWRASFTSDWFSDQQHANKLFFKYTQLRYLVRQQLSNLFKQFLSADNFEACQRMLELYLKLNDKEAIRTTLTIMFDHCYLKRDNKRCKAILKFSDQLSIPIGKRIGFKISNLFVEDSPKKIMKPPKFKFKF